MVDTEGRTKEGEVAKEERMEGWLGCTRGGGGTTGRQSKCASVPDSV